MQIIVTHGSLARTRTLHFSRWQLLGALGALVAVLVLASGAVYHFVFLKAVREGWPLVGDLVRPIVDSELGQRERSMRDSLEAMARRIGEMQARLVRLEVIGERVAGMAGVDAGPLVPPAQAPRAASAGQGGPYLPVPVGGVEELDGALARLEGRADLGVDLFTLIQSRLFESRLQSLLVPSIAPVDGPVGSGFGVRADPISGRPALHAGLDFPADVGTAVHAAAGGVVQAVEWHPQYGRTLEIDHGRGLVTRYAHASAVHVRQGDLVRRGQRIAAVGNTGRSTGPHLHFEVLVDGVPQNPARFLVGDQAGPAQAMAR